MKAHTLKLPRLLLSANTGIAILMVVIAAVVLTALAKQFTAMPALAEEPPAAVAALATTGARLHRCPGCGVIESIRDVAGTQLEPGREITIRLADGSMRVITDANPAKWRQGERVSIIPGSI